MQHQLALLLGRLNPYEPHGRAPHRLTDCLRVGGIVLIALDVGLHILRWHQTDLMAQLINSRAQWCDVAQASMPTRHGARASKNAITWPRRSCFLTMTSSAAPMP